MVEQPLTKQAVVAVCNAKVTVCVLFIVNALLRFGADILRPQPAGGARRQLIDGAIRQCPRRDMFAAQKLIFGLRQRHFAHPPEATVNDSR